MASWTHRRSRKQFARGGHPHAPNLDVAGKNIYAFQRFISAKFPPSKFLEGKTQRRNGSYDPTPFMRIPQYFRRFLPAKYPPKIDLGGNVSRSGPVNPRFGYYDPIKVLRIPQNFQRFCPAQFPPLRYLDGNAIRRFGMPPAWILYTQARTEYYRVADESRNQYEAYLGIDADPNFESSPDATSSSLPFDVALTPPVSGEREYRVVVRRRNAYDLVSQNIYSRKIVIDSTGAQVLSPISPAEEITLSILNGGYVALGAVYYPQQDDNPADMWRVWSAVGSDPVPGVDTPYHEDMTGRTQCRISKVFGPYTAETDLRIIVRAYRSTDGKDDGSTTVYTAAVPGVPDMEEASSFAGINLEYH